MLNFTAEWAQPIDLINGASQNLIYTVKNLEQIPIKPGAYVFARIHGDCLYPLYIGETTDLRKRIEQHFTKNVKLMNGIKAAPTGKRVIIFCTIKTTSEKKRDAMLNVLQRALIEHAMTEGHELLNIQLTKFPIHTIRFKGNRSSEQIVSRKIYVQGK